MYQNKEEIQIFKSVEKKPTWPLYLGYFADSRVSFLALFPFHKVTISVSFKRNEKT